MEIERSLCSKKVSAVSKHCRRTSLFVWIFFLTRRSRGGRHSFGPTSRPFVSRANLILLVSWALRPEGERKQKGTGPRCSFAVAATATQSTRPPPQSDDSKWPVTREKAKSAITRQKGPFLARVMGVKKERERERGKQRIVNPIKTDGDPRALSTERRRGNRPCARGLRVPKPLAGTESAPACVGAPAWCAPPSSRSSPPPCLARLHGRRRLCPFFGFSSYYRFFLIFDFRFRRGTKGAPRHATKKKRGRAPDAKHRKDEASCKIAGPLMGLAFSFFGGAPARGPSLARRSRQQRGSLMTLKKKRKDKKRAFSEEGEDAAPIGISRVMSVGRAGCRRAGGRRHRVGRTGDVCPPRRPRPMPSRPHVGSAGTRRGCAGPRRPMTPRSLNRRYAHVRLVGLAAGLVVCVCACGAVHGHGWSASLLMEGAGEACVSSRCTHGTGGHGRASATRALCPPDPLSVFADRAVASARARLFLPAVRRHLGGGDPGCAHEIPWRRARR